MSETDEWIKKAEELHARALVAEAQIAKVREVCDWYDQHPGLILRPSDLRSALHSAVTDHEKVQP